VIVVTDIADSRAYKTTFLLYRFAAVFARVSALLIYQVPASFLHA